MSTADRYRKIAAELNAKAAKEGTAWLAAEWGNLARCYIRLAEQADANSSTDFWLEVGPRPKLEGEGA